MKSIWIFLLGTVINLGFILLVFFSYLSNQDIHVDNPDKVPTAPYVFVILGLVIAGALARYFDRPGLGNVLVMLLPSLGILAALLFISLFILPKGLGIKPIIGIILAVLALGWAFRAKVGSYKRIFDASKMEAARRNENPSQAYNQKITFTNEGRSGHVWYNGGGGRFSLYYAFGGNDVVAVIYSPTMGEWVEKTGIALGQREQILHEIGAEVVKTQTRSGRYALEGDCIVVYSE